MIFVFLLAFAAIVLGLAAAVTWLWLAGVVSLVLTAIAVSAAEHWAAARSNETSLDFDLELVPEDGVVELFPRSVSGLPGETQLDLRAAAKAS